MLGLRHACGYQEVAIEYNKSLKLIHPDQCFLDGADEAFMKLQRLIQSGMLRERVRAGVPQLPFFRAGKL